MAEVGRTRTGCNIMEKKIDVGSIDPCLNSNSTTYSHNHLETSNYKKV